MRVLEDNDLRWVAGGHYGSTCPECEIIINAPYYYMDGSWNWYEVFAEAGLYHDYSNYIGGVGGSAYNADSLNNDVLVDPLLSPNTDQQNAIDALQTAAYTAVANAISAIPDEAYITMPNGTKVYGSELKAMWQLTDFYVTNGVPYANNSQRGEANFNDGDPKISFDIATLTQYHQDFGAAGVNYLVFHEIGHMTAAGMAYNETLNSDGWVYIDDIASEQFANDISRAIAAYSGAPTLGDGAATTAGQTQPTYGYGNSYTFAL